MEQSIFPPELCSAAKSKMLSRGIEFGSSVNLMSNLKLRTLIRATLASGLGVVLVTARHVRYVPGKTKVPALFTTRRFWNLGSRLSQLSANVGHVGLILVASASTEFNPAVEQITKLNVPTVVISAARNVHLPKLAYTTPPVQWAQVEGLSGVTETTLMTFVDGLAARAAKLSRQKSEVPRVRRAISKSAQHVKALRVDDGMAGLKGSKLKKRQTKKLPQM
jgi:hypothetical protein